MHRPNTDAVRIRRANPTDIPLMRSLELQVNTAAHWTAAQYEELFELGAPSRALYVAADERDTTSVRGFLIARCLPDEWEIENVVVSASQRRQGIARGLIRTLEEAAQSAGASAIILEVRASNVPAARLYESIGFIEEGRRKGYYQNPAEDALLYRHTLHFCDKIS